MVMSSRSRWAWSSTSAQRTVSHMTSAIENIETVYTFSLTVDWFQTVQVVAATRTPAAVAARRAPRSGTIGRSHRSSTRNQQAAEAALVIAAKRLIRTA